MGRRIEEKEIVIFDTDSRELNSISRHLRKDFAVYGFNNIEEVGTHIKDSTPDIMFLRLPEGLNKRYIKTFKECSSLIGILREDTDVVINKALRAGIEAFITSPIKELELKLMVECCLRKKSQIKELKRQKQQLEALLDITTLVSSTQDPQEILFLIVRKISELIPVMRCSIVRIDNKQEKGYVIATFEDPGLKNIKLDLKKYPEIREALSTKAPVIINDVKTDPLMTDVRDMLTPLKIKSILILPVFYKNIIIGTFFLRTSLSSRSFTKDEIDFCRAIASSSANALYSAFLFEKTESEKRHLGRLAITDYLTGLYNIRYLYHRIEEEFSRANRYNMPLTCLMIDIDLFKRINDTYGHKTGDKVLKEFAHVLKKNIRKSDILARYGGEEFIMLLPNTTREGSKFEAERIRHCIRYHKFKALKGKSCIDVSIGAATCPHKLIVTSDELITCADDALFEAKKKGRGKVVVFS